MEEPEEADVCVEAVNGRWFGGRQLVAATWDGKTKYEVHETEEELKARDAQWEKFLKQEQEEAVRDAGKEQGKDKADSTPKSAQESTDTPDIDSGASHQPNEHSSRVDMQEEADTSEESTN